MSPEQGVVGVYVRNPHVVSAVGVQPAAVKTFFSASLSRELTNVAAKAIDTNDHKQTTLMDY